MSGLSRQSVTGMHAATARRGRVALAVGPAVARLIDPAQFGASVDTFAEAWSLLEAQPDRFALVVADGGLPDGLGADLADVIDHLPCQHKPRLVVLVPECLDAGFRPGVEFATTRSLKRTVV